MAISLTILASDGGASSEEMVAGRTVTATATLTGLDIHVLEEQRQERCAQQHSTLASSSFRDTEVRERITSLMHLMYISLRTGQV